MKTLRTLVLMLMVALSAGMTAEAGGKNFSVGFGFNNHHHSNFRGSHHFNNGHHFNSFNRKHHGLSAAQILLLQKFGQQNSRHNNFHHNQHHNNFNFNGHH